MKWNKKKSSESHIHFWWLLIKWSQHDEMWLLKSSHMSVVKVPWLCDLWEDLFAAALWDYRELLNCSISVFFWVSNLAKGAILPPDMTYLKKMKGTFRNIWNTLLLPKITLTKFVLNLYIFSFHSIFIELFCFQVCCFHWFSVTFSLNLPICVSFVKVLCCKFYLLWFIV